MNYRAAARHLAASDLSADMNMDPSGSPASSELNDVRGTQPDPATDELDPASPGGPAPYNADEPYGQPVTSNPGWRDPAEGPNSSGPVPYRPGPGVDTTTIHSATLINARRASYTRKNTRNR